ncbi:T9SS type A sorting domain-containing protein [Postechiella marina]|uniref:T9SS type A sorting domain-containing protein n=1 Tax=Postechiella marina TaxID=943941 RepID=A0ABP8CHZ2_9FLAO
MTSPKLLLIIASLTLFFNVNSQTGPGGVGQTNGSSNLVLWTNPDAITEADNAAFSNWPDLSGHDSNLSQNDAIRQPIIKKNILNGYDVVRFENTNRRLIKTNFRNFPTRAISGFYVNRNADRSDGVLSYASSFHNNDFLIFNSSNVTMYRDRNNLRSGIAANTNAWNIIGFRWTSNGGNTTLSQNGNSAYSNAFKNGTSITPNGTLALAAEQDRVNGNYAANQAHQGDFSEVILFNTYINEAQRIIVSNYLSAKYNINLSANNLYNEDDAANGNFDHNVAGIGQARDGSSHTDSQGSGVVRINTPSNLNSGDYLFWGENTKTPDYTNTNTTTNYKEQLVSTWRVSKTNDLGSVSVSFDLSRMAVPQGLFCSLQLVLDNDSDFSSPRAVYDLSISGTTASVNDVRFNDNDYFTLKYTNQIVWDGSTFFNGSGSSEAPSTFDSCLKLLVKTGTTAVLNTDAHVREIEVEPGASLFVEDGYLLEVEDKVVINGIIDLLGEAQLIQNHTNTSTNSGSGYLRKRQQGTSNNFNYNYWSSPVNTNGFWQIGNLEDANGAINFTSSYNADASTTPITLSNRWLYEFNGVSDDYWQWKSLTTTSNIAPGIGYTMKGSGASGTGQEYVFKGTPNDGNYSLTVTAGNDILTGNPYPSALNADEFIRNNLSVIDGTLYFWEHFESNNSHYLADYEGGYASYNLMMSLEATASAGLISGQGSASKARPTNNVAVGQGFFLSITSDGNLNFNNQQRAFAKESANESIYYKSGSKKNKVAASKVDLRPKVWFAFVDPNELKTVIGLGYDSDYATTAYDNGYDAKLYEEKRNDTYWVANDENLLIQALPNINIEDELPITIKATDEGLYKFSINNMENIPVDINIYLKDNETNVYHNLKSGTANLILSNKRYENRFSIVFQEDNTLDTNDNEDKLALIYYDSKTKNLILNDFENLNDIKALKIYNTLGQEILDKSNLESNKINMASFSNGLYIINIKSSNNIKQAAKFIKY